MIVSTCGCREVSALACARRDHVQAFDDITRAMEQEEADSMGYEDRCPCRCHNFDSCYADTYEDFDDATEA